MKQKILITPKSFSRGKEKAYELLKNYDVEIIENNTGATYTEEQMIELCSDVAGIIVGIDPISKNVLKHAKRLKAISKYGAGLDNIDLETAKEMGIKVKRAVETNSTSVAELTVGMFFLLSRNLYQTVDSVKHAQWDRWVGYELLNKSVGVIGLGAIGREVSRICSGIGMKVLAHDPHFQDERFLNEYNVKLVDLNTIYTNSDFVSLHIPLNDETRHIVNTETLKLMKETAFLINTSRGELVDEEALYQALRDNVIAGAAEDVFSKEPAGEHKLLNLSNFILTSHIGAYTKEATDNMVIKSTENLITMLFN